MGQFVMEFIEKEMEKEQIRKKGDNKALVNKGDQ